MTKKKKIFAVDLFCGVGGLTYGLESAGISVKLGVDIDPNCAFPIEANSQASFKQSDVALIKAEEINQQFKGGDYSLLASCAPCQPFSTYSRAAKKKRGKEAGPNRSDDWRLVDNFSNLVCETRPDMVTMENVPPLVNQGVFEYLIDKLEGYWVD